MFKKEKEPWMDNLFGAHFPDSYVTDPEIRAACAILRENAHFRTVLHWMSDQREEALKIAHSKTSFSNPNFQTYNMNAAGIVNSLLTQINAFMLTRPQKKKL
jgi:hypothetical protein